MRILHIVANPRIDASTLAGRFAALAELGVEVELVRFGSGRKTQTTFSPPEGSFPRHEITVRLGGAQVRRRKLADLLRVRAPDVVHIDDPAHADGAMALELAKDRGIPAVVELRRRPSIAASHRLEAAARILVPDDEIRRALAAAGIGRSTVSVIGACEVIRDDVAVPRPGAWVRATPGIGQRPMLVHASGFATPDDGRYLVELAASLRSRDSAFLLAVVASGAELRELRTRARGTALLGTHLITAHPRGRVGAHALIDAADLVLCTGGEDRWINAVPRAVAAMAHGRPTAVSWDDQFTRRIEMASAGFQLEGDPEWAAFEAVRMLRQPHWRADARRAAQRVAKSVTRPTDLVASEIHEVYAAVSAPAQSRPKAA